MKNMAAPLGPMSSTLSATSGPLSVVPILGVNKKKLVGAIAAVNETPQRILKSSGLSRMYGSLAEGETLS